jgi:tetratricopeptide (TPR) repeat protein
MTSEPIGLARDLTATQHFLYSKTPAEDPRRTPGVAPLPVLPSGIDDPLLQHYPGLRAERAYTTWAAEKAAVKPQFTALALRIDTSARRPADDLERFQQLRLALAAAIDKKCAAENGWWGLVATDIFGVVLPGRDVATGLAIAKALQGRLNASAGISLTIGLAAFPCLKFNPDDVLANARKALEHALFLGPGGRACFDAVSLNISGDRYYDAGDVDGAIREFRNALRLDPKNVNVLNSLGVCFGVQQNYVKALTAFETALKLNPQEILSLYNAGLVNLLMDQREKALRFWLKAAPLGKDVFELNFQAGKLLLESDQPEKAQGLLQRAAELKPDSALVQRFLGDVYLAQRLVDHAVSPYKKALRLHPNDASALSGLGRCYELKNENLDIALAFCQQSVEIKPEEGRFHMRLGRLLKKTGQYQRALETFQKAQALGENARQSILDIEERCLNKAS